MSTAAASSGSSAPSAPRARFGFSDSLRRNTHDNVKAAVKILGTVASVTQDVPYIGVVSKVLAEFLKIEDELDKLETTWKSVMVTARHIKAVIDAVLEQCDSSIGGGTPLPRALREPFDDLEQCLVDVLETFDTYLSTVARKGRGYERFKFYLARVINRSELMGRVEKCRDDLQAALGLFTMRLQIDQSRTIHAMTPILHELRGKALVSRKPTQSNLDLSLPPAPGIFHGRQAEINHVLSIFKHQGPSRVAILGPGGIGKTAISLSILHHPEVAKLFGDRRCFISCEAMQSAEELVQQLLKCFRLDSENAGNSGPQKRLRAYLNTLTNHMLMCLDNLETPWDEDPQGTGSLLSLIASFPHIALLVTKRGTDRPFEIPWTQPFLPPITALPYDEASATWIEICGSQDAYSLRLMEAVDYLPLAIVLLAHLAVSESSETLWNRWELEQTNLLRIHGPEHRLTNIEASIRMSLCGPRLRDFEHAVELFSIMCTLPQGLPQTRTAVIIEVFHDILPDINGSITLLKQLSLMTLSDDGFLRVLSPVRHYMRKFRPISDDLFTRLSGIYCRLVTCVSADYMTEKEYTIRHLQPELGNISEVLGASLTRDKDHTLQYEAPLKAIHDFLHLGRTVSYYNMALLDRAIGCAEARGFVALAAALGTSKGLSLHDMFLTHSAIAAFSTSLAYYRQIDDVAGEADCLVAMSDTYQRIGPLWYIEFRLSRALRLYTKLTSPRGVASVRERLGRLHAQSGRLEHAQIEFNAALSVRRECDDILGMANSEHDLGELLLRRRLFPQAEALLRSALGKHRHVGDKRGEAMTLRTLGSLLMNDGRLWQAKTMLSRSYELSKDIEDRSGEAWTLQAEGTLSHLLRDLGPAESLLKWAIGLHRANDSIQGEAKSWNRLGRVLVDQRRIKEGATCFSKAFNLAVKVDYKIGQGNAKLCLGLLYKLCQDYDVAEVLLEDALRFFNLAHHSAKAEDAKIELRLLSHARFLARDQPLRKIDIWRHRAVTAGLEQLHGRSFNGDEGECGRRNTSKTGPDTKTQELKRSHEDMSADGGLQTWEEEGSIRSSRSNHSDPETWSLSRTSSRASSPERLSIYASDASEHESNEKAQREGRKKGKRKASRSS